MLLYVFCELLFIEDVKFRYVSPINARNHSLLVFNVWMGLLGGGDAAKTAALRKEFEANILPGVYLVPAMVVAINQAQKNGCTYMYV